MTKTPKLPKPVRLLTTKQHKLDKSARLKFATCGVQLAPANSAGFGTLCAKAKACIQGCIAETGRNGMALSRGARRRRTILYRFFNALFFAQLFAEITLWGIERKARGYRLAMRPNVTSDQPMLARRIAEQFPEIMVYDYTRLPRPAERRLANYHLTFSYSEETTPADVQHCIQHRMNIAVIFAVKKGARLPKSVILHGYEFPVIDGDRHDLRFLDPSDRSYVVGLRWKHSKDSRRKLARAIAAGLVIDPNVGQEQYSRAA